MTPVPDDVRAFLDRVPGAGRRADAETLLDLIGRITGESPRMWGPSIIGFGEYHYKYESGREGNAPAAGFAPRKPATTIYLPDGTGRYAGEAARLGPHTTGVGCLYIKRLGEVDLAVLESIIDSSYRTVTAGTFPHRARDSGTPAAQADG